MGIKQNAVGSKRAVESRRLQTGASVQSDSDSREYYWFRSAPPAGATGPKLALESSSQSGMSAVTPRFISGRATGTESSSQSAGSGALFRAFDFCRRVCYYGRWHLTFAARKGSEADLAHSVAFCNIEPPVDFSYADPFLFTNGGKTYIFFEIYSRTSHGVIAYCEILGPGRCTEPRVILEAPYHLSYPFVFHWENEIYLIPESLGNETVDLYRAVAFPDRWALDRTLMAGVKFADTTLHFEGDTWWLFTGHQGAGAKAISELHLFMSESPQGPWRSHPRNPVVVGEHCSRPAGRLFHMGPQLVRPGQDSSRLYGEAIWLNRVDVLSPTEYRESPLMRLEAASLPRSCRTHTLDFNEHWQVQDGLRYVPRFRWSRAILPEIPFPAKANSDEA